LKPSTLRSHELVAVYLLTFGVYLFPAVGALGQTQKPGDVRSVDLGSTISWSAEPDSPGTASSVGARQQVSGASPGFVVPRLMKLSGTLHDASGNPAHGIDYARLTALLVEAVKQQQSEIEQEKTEIRSLEAQVRQLQASKADAVQPESKGVELSKSRRRIPPSNPAEPGASSARDGRGGL